MKQKKHIRKYKGFEIKPNEGSDNYLKWCVIINGERDRKFKTLRETREFISSTIKIVKWMETNQRMLTNETLPRWKIQLLDKTDPTWRTTDYTTGGEIWS